MFSNNITESEDKITLIVLTLKFVNGPLKIDFSAGCVWLGENELHLTPIEYKLLCVLAHNVGKVLTHTSITQQIWGSTQENDIASLRVYMASLRKKLERYPDAPHLIQTLEHRQLFRIFRALFQIAHAQIAAEGDFSFVVAFLTGQDIQ